MREIKYRAWLIKEKRMVDVMSFGFNKGYGVNEIHVDVPDFDPYEEIIMGNKPPHRTAKQRIGIEWYVNKPDLDPFEIMEYIGVKDKNGKDIYEDDIVTAWSTGFKGTFQIKWRQEGSPCWILFPAYQNREFWNISATHHTKGKQFIGVDAKIETTSREGYFDDGIEIIGDIYRTPDLVKA